MKRKWISLPRWHSYHRGDDYVIAMTGYQPDFNLLRHTGIQLSNDEVLQPAYDPETMETNLPNIYLAGVVCGGMNTRVWFMKIAECMRK